MMVWSEIHPLFDLLLSDQFLPVPTLSLCYKSLLLIMLELPSLHNLLSLLELPSLHNLSDMNILETGEIGSITGSMNLETDLAKQVADLANKITDSMNPEIGLTKFVAGLAKLVVDRAHSITDSLNPETGRYMDFHHLGSLGAYLRLNQRSIRYC